MPKLRNLIIIVALIFLFFSLLGIIGGNSFFTVLKKSFLGTLLLSLLLSGAFYIINKIVSGVSVPNSEEKNYGQDIASGSPSNNIDIVLEKENPYEITGADLILDNGNSSLSQGGKANGSLSAEHLVEEVEEDSLGDINALDIKAQNDEIVEVMNDNLNNSDSLSAVDLQKDIFGNEDSVTFAGKKQNEALNSLGDDVNAETMAKAIKTVITRDEKGKK